jgi:BlaI family transcriptional regulator, penicillinase repressor
MRRGRTTRDVPPPLELQCLCSLWRLGEANVQGVRDDLAPRRALAYTTVMTMLDRLTRKQVVTRRKVGRSFVYTPSLTRNEVRQRAIRELVESLFDGNEDALKRHLSGQSQAAAAGGDDEPVSLDAALL